MVSIAGSIPKADLLQYPLERLRKEIYLVFNLRRKNEVRTSYFLDPLKRFVSINIVLPRERFSESVRRKIQNFVEKEFGAKADSTQFQLSVTEHSLVVLRLLVPNTSASEPRLDLPELTDQITDLTLYCADKLRHLLGKNLERASA